MLLDRDREDERQQVHHEQPLDPRDADHALHAPELPIWVELPQFVVERVLEVEDRVNRSAA